MNAKERLRAYLEQRRELGESEMMLDALDVDDVMRMLGALQGGNTAGAVPTPAAPSASDAMPRALMLDTPSAPNARCKTPKWRASTPPACRTWSRRSFRAA